MKNILLVLSITISLISYSQGYLNQVFILNEGYFDYTNNQIVVPPTLGSYDPANQTYTTVDTISGARFTSDMVLDGDFLYIAADNQLFKYNKNDYSLVASQQVDGIRNLGVWNDKIIVSRGDYDNVTFLPIIFNSYLQVYNSSDLSLHMEIDTLNGPKWSTQNIVINGNDAYIAVNNAYEYGNEKGIVGILDLNNMTYGNEVDLGANGKNPDNMVLSNGKIVTVNNKDWTGSSISKIDITTNSLDATIDLASVSTGCGTSSLRDDKLVYQISMGTSLNEFDLNQMNNIGPISNYNLNFYSLAQNPVDGNLYTSNTDFFSYGKIYIYDSNDSEVLNFDAGITPGAIVFDVVTNAGISENESSISFYPNPANKKLNLNNEFNGTIEVINVLGQKIMTIDSKNTLEINISDLKNGKYILNFIGENGLKSFKSFVKF